jgi:hypothetical protein
MSAMYAALNVILELTEEIQTAIDAGEWQRASDIDVERRTRLENLIAEHGSSDDSSAMRNAFAALLERNRRMIGEVDHHRRAVLRDASMIRTGQAAVSSYGAAPAEL